MKYVINLNVRSHYSFLSSTIKIQEYIAFAKNNNLAALALTDKNIMHGAYEFYQLCLENNIKPIIGLDCTWQHYDGQIELTLLATSYTGYQKLMALSTMLVTKNAMINHHDVQKYLNKSREILIIIHPPKDSIRYIKTLYDMLNTTGYELVYFGLNHDDLANFKTFRNITKNIIPLNLVLSLSENDHPTYQILQAIKEQKTLTIADLKQDQQYVYQTLEQIKSHYSQEMIDNLNQVVMLCDLKFPVIEKITKTLNLPVFPCPNNYASTIYLQELCKKGLATRLQTQEVPTTYVDRILAELQIINQMGFADYFLIVHDYVNFAKSKQIMIGPGRGSVAGSLVAYVLGITDVDPLVYHLVFERFLNPFRTSLPDIDIDFEDTRREEIIQYLWQKYGQDHVAYIVTFQTIASKMAIRDLGRIFQINIDEINEICKLIPLQDNFDLAKAIKQSPKLSWYANKYQVLFTLAQKIIGFPRQTSTHAAGIILSKYPLGQEIPLQLGFHGIYQTQFAMQDLEKLGLIKMDILGLRNLTILQNIIAKVKEYYFTIINLTDLPLNDQKTFSIIKNGDTTGIFQLESLGMRQILRAMQVNSFEDIVATSALFRPGPQEYIKTYLNRKLGHERVSYLHRDLIPYLQPTYGIIIYQEQILLILQKIGGYSLAKADLILRAIGKKDVGNLKKAAASFINCASENGYPTRIAKKIWANIEQFGGYGFNRSHAVAYSLISYYLAYLKANFALAFMVCLLTSVIGNDQKMLQYLNECQKYQIKILIPSINYSGVEFLIDSQQNAIRYSLQAIKQMSQGTCTNLIKERQENGNFKDFFNFCARGIFIGLNRQNLEFLIAAGTLDDLEPNRTMLLLNLDSALEYSNMVQVKENEQKQLNLALIAKPIMLECQEDWNTNSINEHRALGIYLKYNPKLWWKEKLDPHNITIDLGNIDQYLNKYVKVFGIINNVKTIKAKNEKLMAFLTLQNDNNVIEVTVFATLYQKFQDALQEKQVILIEAKVDNYQDKIHLILNKVLAKL